MPRNRPGRQPFFDFETQTQLRGGKGEVRTRLALGHCFALRGRLAKMGIELGRGPCRESDAGDFEPQVHTRVMLWRPEGSRCRGG